jgi:cytochrome c556
MFNSKARSDFRNRVGARARPTRSRAAVAACVCALSVGTGSLAGADGAPRPEALIKWRQSAFQVVAWNTQRLKSALAADAGDARELQAAANALAAVAASGLPDLFAPGTEHGRGWRETTAAASVFTDATRFRARSDDFAREAALLARLSAGGDRTVMREQFAKVAKICKACHDKFRATD